MNKLEYIKKYYKKNKIIINIFILLLIIITLYSLLFGNKIEDNILKDKKGENITTIEKEKIKKIKELESEIIIKKEFEIKELLKKQKGKLENLEYYHFILRNKNNSAFFKSIYNVLEKQSKKGPKYNKESWKIKVKEIKSKKGKGSDFYNGTISFEINNIFNSKQGRYEIVYEINDTYYKIEELIGFFSYFNVSIDYGISSNKFSLNFAIDKKNKDKLKLLSGIELKYIGDDFDKDRNFPTIYILK